jgi:serine/threonine protein kinase
MDFCKGGTLNDLNDWVVEQRWLNEENRISLLLPIIHGLLTALKQLHSLHLGHRDLHEGNVLFDHEGTLNIGDFGRAKKKVLPFYPPCIWRRLDFGLRSSFRS